MAFRRVLVFYTSVAAPRRQDKHTPTTKSTKNAPVKAKKLQVFFTTQKTNLRAWRAYLYYTRVGASRRHK